MDDVTRDAVVAWLATARRDLDSAVRLVADVPPYRDTATYHCQQAAEKALKALLTAAEISFPKTHDLTVLLALAATKHADVAALADAAVVLTPYATLFRYPSVAVEPDDADVKEALSLARQVLETVERQLGITGQPST